MIPADHDWLDVLGAISGFLLGMGGISALITALLYIFKIGPERRLAKSTAGKTDAETQRTKVDTTEAIVEMWQNLVKQLEGRVTQLEEAVKKKTDENSCLSERIDFLDAEIEELRDWIKQQGLIPPPRKTKGRSNGDLI